MLLSLVLLSAATIASIAWMAVAFHVLDVERRRTTARALVADAMARLKDPAVRGLSHAERTNVIRPLLDRSTREMLMHAAADPQTPDETFDVIAAYIGDRWSGQLERDAAAHTTARDKWRRIAACRILFRLNHPAAFDLIARALEQSDDEVADACFALLGQSSDPRAMDLLVDALLVHRHPASRVASYIDHSQQPARTRLLPLLRHADPVVRFWAATLLARYPDGEVSAEIGWLADDADSRVRKAAIQTLGAIGGDAAIAHARRLLSDRESFVRAHAARALGTLEDVDSAEQVAQLLGDQEWWTRLAARESLEAMGSDVWPVLVRALDHDDRFVRNGAAEVIQNIGVLDSLIVMEAASDSPAPAKLELLRRVLAAGGVRYADSLVERAGDRLGARVRALMATLDVEHVGAR